MRVCPTSLEQPRERFCRPDGKASTLKSKKDGSRRAFKRYSTKACRSMLTRSTNAATSRPGSGSSTTLPTPVQRQESTEASSPAVVSMILHPIEVPSFRNIVASSSKLKTGRASSPEARAIVITSIPPDWWFTISQNGLGKKSFTRGLLSFSEYRPGWHPFIGAGAVEGSHRACAGFGIAKRSHNQDGAGGVASYPIGDAPHERPPYPPTAPASHEDQVHPDLPGECGDLLGRSFFPPSEHLGVGWGKREQLDVQVESGHLAHLHGHPGGLFGTLDGQQNPPGNELSSIFSLLAHKSLHAFASLGGPMLGVPHLFILAGIDQNQVSLRTEPVRTWHGSPKSPQRTTPRDGW